MKKTLALLLACSMLLPVFAACGEDKPATVTQSTVETTTAATTADPTAPNIPSAEELGDISGDFHILVSGNWTWNDYASEGEDGTVIDAAIYRRNQYMLETYGINITNTDVVAFDSSNGSGTGYKKIYTAYMAGDDIYAAAMVGTHDVATLAYNGYLHDMNDINYLDLSKPYWDQKANEDLSIRGKMYYTTGDISVADNRAADILFFSKTMIEEYDLDNPYELVREGKWTLDKFGQMVKSVGEDVNQDGVYGAGDTFGLLTPTSTHPAILAAANERVCAVNDNGELELTLYNERVVNLYDKYLDIVTDHTHVLNYQMNYMTGEKKSTATNDERVSMLNNNQALFYSHTMFYIDSLRDLDNDFGILPFPKYDEAQENYCNLVSSWHCQFVCVPETVLDLDRTGVVLELLAYKGKELLTPAYYEKTVVGQRTRDEESIEMLDIIFSNLVYDLGMIYNIGTYKDKICDMVRTGQSLTNIYETYKIPAQMKLNTINNFFAQNTGS